MVVDGEKPGMLMKMGNVPIEPCQEQYECGGCVIDKDFMAEVKSTIAEFRKKYL
jgi:hypothetical protein